MEKCFKYISGKMRTYFTSERHFKNVCLEGWKVGKADSHNFALAGDLCNGTVYACGVMGREIKYLQCM
jgi:hypothetical protein